VIVLPCELFSCVFESCCERLHCPAVESDAEDCGYYSCEYCIHYEDCIRPEKDSVEEEEVD